MRNIIIGAGQIGKSLCNVVKSPENPTILLDYHTEKNIPMEQPDILHICFTYSDEFISEVKRYQKLHNPLYTVIHSTVPVGTCRQLNAISSPCRGIHPNLESGIRTFHKFLGGEQASEVADYFRKAGIKVMLFDKPETTEAMKLFDTEYYKTCIDFMHRVKRYCDKHDLNFHEVYTLGNQTYNEGYTKLGMPEVVRPVLQPIMKPIGGHCLLPNSELIKINE